jgi:two-component system, OmpR family, response regulator MtrA
MQDQGPTRGSATTDACDLGREAGPQDAPPPQGGHSMILKKRILIIEDDTGTAEALGEKITAAGYQAIVRHTAQEGFAAFRHESPALVVLDIKLPDGDGIEICRQIRRESRTPILMLTAMAEETDRIVGLEQGADDYVVKPFSPKEVISRIKAILRRVDGPTQLEPEPEPALYTAAGIELNVARCEVRVDGSPVRLSPTEFKILARLMQDAGRVVSRDDLVQTIWGYDGFSSNLLEIHVGKIRRKIETDPRRPLRLITVRAFGYKIPLGSITESK